MTGSSLRIEKHEVVHDVTVLGGSLEVLGTVTGDIDVAGGSTKVRSGARVYGDISTMGGSVVVDDSARVDGDIEVVGGSLSRSEKAIIGGNVNSDATPRDNGESESTAARLATEAGEAVTRMALLWVFGAMLLALATRRMETLRADVAVRPMKLLATGIVGILAGIVVAGALTITLIGIPFAAIGLLLAFFAAFAGACSVLETAGAAVLGHRTKNPYVHLAAGCAAMLILGSIPWVGGLLWAAVFLIGFGAIVATRAAGLIKPRAGAGAAAAGPFRSLFL